LDNSYNMEMCSEDDVMATFEKSVKFNINSMQCYYLFNLNWVLVRRQLYF
jgi:hypothetical protein